VPDVAQFFGELHCWIHVEICAISIDVAAAEPTIPSMIGILLPQLPWRLHMKDEPFGSVTHGLMYGFPVTM
jgi:hypothetical protein